MMAPSTPSELVILAGGINSRMESLRGTIYKAFLPIHGLSCIARQVIRAAAYGIRRVDVIVDEYDPALSVLATSGQTAAIEHALCQRGRQFPVLASDS